MKSSNINEKPVSGHNDHPKPSILYETPIQSVTMYKGVYKDGHFLARDDEVFQSHVKTSHRQSSSIIVENDISTKVIKPEKKTTRCKFEGCSYSSRDISEHREHIRSSHKSAKEGIP